MTDSGTEEVQSWSGRLKKLEVEHMEGNKALKKRKRTAGSSCWLEDRKVDKKSRRG